MILCDGQIRNLIQPEHIEIYKFKGTTSLCFSNGHAKLPKVNSLSPYNFPGRLWNERVQENQSEGEPFSYLTIFLRRSTSMISGITPGSSMVEGTMYSLPLTIWDRVLRSVLPERVLASLATITVSL
jgi:hypothetical protein